MPSNVAVFPICLPGRMKRMSEPLVKDLKVLVNMLVDEFFALPGTSSLLSSTPFSFFGHSMGALLSFEIAVELKKRNMPTPSNLFLCGSAPPSYRAELFALACSVEGNSFDYENADPLTVKFTHKLSLRNFTKVVRAMGGTAEEILSNPDLVEFFLPPVQGISYV